MILSDSAFVALDDLCSLRSVSILHLNHSFGLVVRHGKDSKSGSWLGSDLCYLLTRKPAGQEFSVKCWKEFLPKLHAEAGRVVLC